jgi:redox-sensing transcriptional repressor
MDSLEKLIKDFHISIAILTVPPESAKKIADRLSDTGIRGILNFTTVPLNMPPHIFLEEYDMITSLEKVAYYVKFHRE